MKVHFTFNGYTLKIGDCVKKNMLKGVLTDDCFVADFLEYIDKIIVKGDLDELCMQEFVPPQ